METSSCRWRTDEGNLASWTQDSSVVTVAGESCIGMPQLCKLCSSPHPVSSKAVLFLTLREDCLPLLVCSVLPYHLPGFPYVTLVSKEPETGYFPPFSPGSKFSGVLSVVSSLVPSWFHPGFRGLFSYISTWRWPPHGRAYDPRVPPSATVHGLKYPPHLHIRWLFILQCVIIKPLLDSRWPGLLSHHSAKLYLLSLRHLWATPGQVN